MTMLDVPTWMSSAENNRRTLVLAEPPEPTDTGCMLRELVEDLNEVAQHGVQVTHNGHQFMLKFFVFDIDCDAMARAKLMKRGGPGRFVSCYKCSQQSSYLVGSTWYPAGYAKPVTTLVPSFATRRQPSDGEVVPLHPSGHPMVQHFAGSQHFQLTHVEMLEQANHVEWLKGEVRNAETSSKARLEEFMHYSGCSGKSALFELEYFDMSRTVREPLAHQFLLGMWKTDFWQGVHELLGHACAVKFYGRIDQRRKVNTTMYHACQNACLLN